MGLRAVEQAPVAPLPTLEALIEGKGTQTPETSQEPSQPKEEVSRLDQIERDQKLRRELFSRDKRIKELEAKLGDTSNKTSILDAKNPIKALAKERNFSQDDVIKMALEAMDDDLTETEKKEDLAKMSPEQIAKLVREQIELENQAKDQVEKETQAVKDYKLEIANKAKELESTMPMVAALGASDAVFDMINNKFMSEKEEYGEEYARENLMSIDEAIKKTNETLANNVKSALQSKYLRDFILKTIKEEGSKNEKPNQLNDEDQLEDEAITMTNFSHRAVTEASGKPKFASNEEELDYLINKLI